MVMEIDSIFFNKNEKVTLTWNDDDTYTFRHTKAGNLVKEINYTIKERALAKMTQFYIKYFPEGSDEEDKCFRREAAHIKAWDEANIQW